MMKRDARGVVELALEDLSVAHEWTLTSGTAHAYGEEGVNFVGIRNVSTGHEVRLWEETTGLRWVSADVPGHKWWKLSTEWHGTDEQLAALIANLARQNFALERNKLVVPIGRKRLRLELFEAGTAEG